MKCNACGASWDETTVNKTLLACPFCGEVLEKKKPKKTKKKKNKTKGVKDVLREIIGLKGEDILTDRDVTIGLISDLAPKMTKERRQLGMMYDVGAVKSILSGCHQTKAEQQRICRKVMKQLIDDLDMEEDAAAELAGEVCSGIYGRKTDVRQKKTLAEKITKKASDETAVPKSETDETEKKQSKPKKQTAAKKGSTGTAQSKPQSAGTATPVISNAGTTKVTPQKPSAGGTKGSQKRSVLAGASMVKSQQTLQQAALPNAGGGSASGGNTASGQKKKNTRRSGGNQQTSNAASTNYNYGTGQQSNWTPTPQQLQAYQYYTGKPYPQSNPSPNGGRSTWLPSYKAQSSGSGNSHTAYPSAANGYSSGRGSGQTTQQTRTQNQPVNRQQNTTAPQRNRTNTQQRQNTAANPLGNSRQGAQTSQTSPYLQPAMAGDAAAMYQLGLQYLRGSAGIVKDVNEGIKWITGAANKGEENAKFMLGYLYYSGTEIAKNESEALKWFLKSVKPTDYEVQFLIGMLYAYGTTITRNYTEAFKWFYKSGMGGNVQAQFALGDFYHNGYDMEVNEREAANWYAKAAKQGHAKAQQMLDRLNVSSNPQPETTTRTQSTRLSTRSNYGTGQQTHTAQLPPQTQSWLNGNAATSSTQTNSWQQRQLGNNAQNAGTRSPGWRQNQNIGVVSSNRSFQSLPSESQYTLGQSFGGKVNRSLLQDDDDDDWINMSRRKGFTDSQT